MADSSLQKMWLAGETVIAGVQIVIGPSVPIKGNKPGPIFLMIADPSVSAASKQPFTRWPSKSSWIT